jgi:hypothetical protein
MFRSVVLNYHVRQVRALQTNADNAGSFLRNVSQDEKVLIVMLKTEAPADKITNVIKKHTKNNGSSF